MITKNNVFASAGKLDAQRTDADFRNGMIPNTVAMAEDVNTYGNKSDKDLKVVCDEICNALKGQGIDPNNSYNVGEATQLNTMLKEKITGAFAMTGIVYDSYTTAPKQTGDTIHFTQFDVMFNQNVYYGNTQSTFIRVTIEDQDVTPTDWDDGPVFLYATTYGDVEHQKTPVLGQDGNTKCYLGSAFIVKGKLQEASWCFQPWLQITSVEQRSSPTATRKGGFISPASGKAIQMGTLQVQDEGINFENEPADPSIKTFQEKNPFAFKLLYPGYDPSTAEYKDLDYACTHIYNAQTGAMVDVSSLQGKFICLVPCISPTGQGLMVPAMTDGKHGDGYTDAVFDTQEAANKAIFGLKYSLGNVANRCIYLGQTLVVQIKLTDTEDGEQFTTYGTIPQSLAGFTDASGQTGGGAGEYIPMPSITWNQLSIPVRNNSVNIVTGSTSQAIQITLPNNTPDIVNQIEIHYNHTGSMKGITFPSEVGWWGSAPTWVVGTKYNIILEWVAGKWMAGYLSAAI